MFVGVAAFLGSEVVLSSVVSGWVLVGVVPSCNGIPKVWVAVVFLMAIVWMLPFMEIFIAIPVSFLPAVCRW